MTRLSLSQQWKVYITVHILLISLVMFTFLNFNFVVLFFMNEIMLFGGLQVEIRAVLESGDMFCPCSKSVIVYQGHLLE